MLNFGSDADITRIKIAAVLGGNKKCCENKYIYIRSKFRYCHTDPDIAHSGRLV